MELSPQTLVQSNRITLSEEVLGYIKSQQELARSQGPDETTSERRATLVGRELTQKFTGMACAIEALRKNLAER